MKPRMSPTYDLFENNDYEMKLKEPPYLYGDVTLGDRTTYPSDLNEKQESYISSGEFFSSPDIPPSNYQNRNTDRSDSTLQSQNNADMLALLRGHQESIKL